VQCISNKKSATYVHTYMTEDVT